MARRKNVRSWSYGDPGAVYLLLPADSGPGHGLPDRAGRRQRGRDVCVNHQKNLNVSHGGRRNRFPRGHSGACFVRKETDEWRGYKQKHGRVAKCCNTPLVKREERRVKRKCVPSGRYLNYFRKKIPLLFTFRSSLFSGAVAFCNSPLCFIPADSSQK